MHYYGGLEEVWSPKKIKILFSTFFCVHKSYMGLRYSWSSDYLFGEAINVKCEDFVLFSFYKVIVCFDDINTN